MEKVEDELAHPAEGADNLGEGPGASYSPSWLADCCLLFVPRRYWQHAATRQDGISCSLHVKGSLM